MYLVVGLGNPGPQYAGNRHNAGFMVIERLRERWEAPPLREKFSARFCKAEFRGEDVVLLQPQTYMNLSGESVQKAMRFFKVPLERVIVIYDELDLDFETLRIKVGGGTAGHNGLKSIVQHGGSNDFVRVRFGIGRPKHGEAHGHVLGDFGADERITLDKVVDDAAKMVEAIVGKGVQTAMNRLNKGKGGRNAKKPKPPRKSPAEGASETAAPTVTSPAED